MVFFPSAGISIIFCLIPSPGEDPTGSKQDSLLGRQSSGPAGHGQAGLTRGSLGAVSAPKTLETLVAGQLSTDTRMPMSQVGKPSEPLPLPLYVSAPSPELDLSLKKCRFLLA